MSDNQFGYTIFFLFSSSLYSFVDFDPMIDVRRLSTEITKRRSAYKISTIRFLNCYYSIQNFNLILFLLPTKVGEKSIRCCFLTKFNVEEYDTDPIGSFLVLYTRRKLSCSGFGKFMSVAVHSFTILPSSH